MNLFIDAYGKSKYWLNVDWLGKLKHNCHPSQDEIEFRPGPYGQNQLKSIC